MPDAACVVALRTGYEDQVKAANYEATMSEVQILKFDQPLPAEAEAAAEAWSFSNWQLYFLIFLVIVAFAVLRIIPDLKGPDQVLRGAGCLGAVVVVFGITLLFFRSLQKDAFVRRRVVMQGVAQKMAASFTAFALVSTVSEAQRFRLFTQQIGVGGTLKNLLAGRLDETNVRIFDCKYQRTSGKNTYDYAQTVIYLEHEKLDLPYFSVEPQFFHPTGLLRKITDSFGYQDIDFADRPQFSENYLLRGSDEKAIRSIFNNDVTSYIGATPGLCIDGGGHKLFVYETNVTLSPDGIQSRLRLSLQLLQAMRS
jgi:hypothetical protein